MTALDRSLTLRPELLPINSAVARGIVDSRDFYALASLLLKNNRAADRLRLGAAIPHGDGQINDMLHLLQRLDASRAIHDQDPDALDDLADEFADLTAQIVSGLHYRAEYWRDLRLFIDGLMIREKRLSEALRTAQKALAIVTDQNAIKSTTVSNAWAACVEAEVKARNVLADQNRIKSVDARAWREDRIRDATGWTKGDCDLCGDDVTADNLASWDEDGHVYCTAHGPLIQPEDVHD